MLCVSVVLCVLKKAVCVCSVSAVCVSAVCPLCVCCVDVVAPVELVFHGDQSGHSVASPLPPPVQLPAPNDESRSLRNMVHQLIDVCRANQSHLTGPGGGCSFEVVGEHVGCKTTPSSNPFRSPGQSWSSARSSSVEGQADWTSAPCLPP